MTVSQIKQVTDDLTSMGDSGQLTMVAACPGGPVMVGLSAGQEPLAARLNEHFGHELVIWVGLTSYAGKPGRSPKCGSLEPSATVPSGLQLTLNLPSRAIRSGSQFDGTIVGTKEGPGTFEMDTGEPLQAVLVRPGTLQVVGVFDGGIGGVGRVLHLSAGQRGTISVIGGTARCDGGIGSALPPGRYQAIVRVAPEGPPHNPGYLTTPVSVVVTRG